MELGNRLYISTVILLMLSLVMVYSMSLFSTTYFNTTKYLFLERQAIAVFLGILILTLLGSMRPDRNFKILGFLLFLVSIASIIAMMFLPSSLVREVLGAKRWIKIGFFSIAPTEFFKYGFVFLIAWSIDRRYRILSSAKSVVAEYIYLLPYFIVLIATGWLIAVGQKDLGQVAVLVASLLALLYLSGISKRFFFSILIFASAGFYYLIISAPHRVYRFKGWWVGIQDMIPLLPDSLKVTDMAIPMHIKRSLNAIHNGGIFGQGIGDGQFKLGYLSEVHTDFILAGTAEELGFIGIVGITFLLFYIVKLIFDIASKLENRTEKFFAYGVGIILSVEFIINSFGITGMIPIKGIAVPLLSYGGSQIIATSIGIGMVLMVSNRFKKQKKSSRKVYL